MIEEEFYATLKFKNGEEIFAKVSPTEEEERTLLLVSHPITIAEIKARNGMQDIKWSRGLRLVMKIYLLLI